MEWVEVRGATLAAAEEEALDQLGVARDDAEFEVVQEPENRWMGLKKTEARVRARVKPTQPRAKADGGRGNRRSRGKRGRPAGSGGSSRDAQGGSEAKQGGGGSRRGNAGGKGNNQRSRSGGGGRSQNQDGRERNAKSGQSARGSSSPDRSTGSRTKKEAAVSDSEGSRGLMPLEEQQKTVTDFLEGVVSGFGLDAAVSTRVDDDTIVGSIDGSGLGLLIGPRGGTLQAIQELSRSALQRSSDGRDTNRLKIDVGGYRDRRAAALVEFARRQAGQVEESGTKVALEPMSSLDRKTVHDAVAEMAGVTSTSEGDDPFRHVVLLPEG